MVTIKLAQAFIYTFHEESFKSLKTHYFTKIGHFDHFGSCNIKPCTIEA